MFQKIADILGKLNGVVLLAAALGIVALVFVIGLVLSFGGELGKFKKVAKKAVKNPTLSVFNATAKQLPVRARKQYKAVKQTGGKPDDIMTIDACVYSPYKESVAAHFPGAVMAAGILAILFAFFAVSYIKPDKLVNLEAGETYHYVIPRRNLRRHTATRSTPPTIFRWSWPTRNRKRNSCNPISSRIP